MKKILVAALALGGVSAGSAAYATSTDDVMARLAALEKENAAIRKENAALRENNELRKQNATLKSAASQIAAQPGVRRDPFGAYATDMPTTYKAPAAREPGRLRVWGEGGAMWSGGDPVNTSYTLRDPGNIFASGFSDGAFNLKPDIGWEAAGGFDYRFDASSWHVSGQFRYGEARRSAQDSVGSSIPPGVLAILGADALGLGVDYSSVGGSDSITATNTETHWLADLAIGRDVIGSGADAMQVKFGVRVGQFEARTTATQLTQTAIGLSGVVSPVGFAPFQQVLLDARNIDQRSSRFLGVGPRFGVEGAVPFAGQWSLDYLGDVAVLFGNRTSSDRASASNQLTPSYLPALVPDLIFTPDTLTTSSSRRFATVFNADLQVGVSYWVMSNMKVSASYRLDAYFNVVDGLPVTGDPTRLQSTDRYIHGPHLGLSATF